MKILHISDIHLSKVWENTTSRMIGKLGAYLQANNIYIDFIVISGDLIDKGGMSYGSTSVALEAFDRIVMEPLIKAIGIDRSHVIICPGNHEVEGSKVDSDTDNKIKSWSPTLDSSIIGNLYYAELVGHTDMGNQLKARVEAYQTYRDSLVNEEVIFHRGPLESSVKFNYDSRKIGFTSFDSIWRCDERGVGNPFVLGCPQINESKIFMEDCDLKIAIMHNHPSMLDDFEKNDVKLLLSSVYDILLLGHSHSGDEGRIQPPGGGVIFYIQSPGIIVYNAGGNHKFVNGFRIIDYNFETATVEVTNYIQGADEEFRKDNNYINDGVWKEQVKDHDSILPIQNSLLKQSTHTSPFISAPIYDSIIRNLRDNTIKEFLLVAMTGLGKTRLLYEAFRSEREYPDKAKCYYCNLSNNKEKVLDQAEFLMKKHPDGCTIILDNCPIHICNAAVKLRNDTQPEVRIIGVSNDISNDRLRDQPHNEIPLKAVKGAVDSYINNSIDDSGSNLTIKTEIIKISDGFPMLAISLVEKFKNGKDFNIHDADDLVRQLLGTNLDEDEMQLMMMVALFQPFPITHNAMNLLAGSPNLSVLEAKSPFERAGIISKVKNKFSDTLLDINDAGWNVRPYPLAIYLASKWFEAYGTEEIFEGLLDEIEKFPDPPKQLIIECMAKRLEKMDESYAAQELVGKLTDRFGVFRSEKAVSSEVGSRLFLAMSTVNPSKVAECLNCVVASQSDGWIAELNLKARRNIIGALTKLIFDESSFDQAIRCLARFAIQETDWSISNNAANLFCQVFRIILPGTEVSLDERGRYLKELVESNAFNQSLLLDVLKSAYSFGSAVRFGGNSFGNKTKKDYEVRHSDELRHYWDICNKIALNLLDREIGIDCITEIVKNNLYRWAMGGVLNMVVQLVERIFRINGYALNLTKIDIDRINARLRGNRQNDLVDWMGKMQPFLIPDTFVAKLINATKEFHQNHKSSYSNFFEYRDSFFRQYVEEFLSREFYKDAKEIRDLLKEHEPYSMYFAPVLGETISQEQLLDFLDILVSLISRDRSLLECPFILYFLPAIYKRFDIEDFLCFIKNTSVDSYIGLLSRCEDPKLSILHRLKGEFGISGIGRVLPIYLYRCNRYMGESTTRLISFLNENFSAAPYDIANYLLRNFSFYGSEESELIPVIRDMLMRYDIKEDSLNTQYEYWEYMTELLKIDYTQDFAVWINNKIIENANAFESSYGRNNFYDFMLPDHAEDIWTDLIDALFNENPTFYYSVYEDLGSGYGFGTGALFKCDSDKLKEAIAENVKYAPERIASMCPVFVYTSGSYKSSFSDWAIYLMDNYPTKNVLDALHSNMNTYQWTGSIIPLLNRKIEAFTKITSHNRQLIRDWAKSNIDQLEKELKSAQAEEDFMRQHYD